MHKPLPFRLHVDDEAIADLRHRLAKTRWPDQAAGDPWQTGTDLAWLQALVDYWQHGFDWRRSEAALNGFAQFRARLHGIDLHWLQIEGRPGGRPAMPLLLLHGWPGSVFEFLRLIPLLTDPAAHGGDPDDAFTVIVPSLPGYGLSYAAGQPRFSVERMADCLVELMRDVLGFRRFGTQGGDWGASIAARIGHAWPNHAIGVHLNLLPLPRDPNGPVNPTPAEARYQMQLRRWLQFESGYAIQQGTRPQTLAYALTDSPVGLAGWILEKFRAWSDCKGDIDSVFDRDELLANVSLYWFTGCIGASFWPYYARLHDGWPIPAGGTIDIPTGYCAFPREILSPPRSLAEAMFTDIRRWTEMPQGGHFAALEQPAALAAEIRAFYRPLRP